MLSKVLIVLAVLVAFCAFLAQWEGHVFDPAVLQKISKDALAKYPEDAQLEMRIDAVVAAMRKTYPNHILKEPEWMYNVAGGAMGAMLVLHCSLSEYIIIFGTSLGTEGHTGRFLADDYFTILHGEQWAMDASPGKSALKREVYKPGDQHHLKFGQAKQYKMPEQCWALEYARGNIPAMLPFGFADSLFSTLDYHSLFTTVRVSAVGIISELLQGKI